MDFITNSYSTPTENLAFEEYFFQHFERDTLRLWINPRSVIVGKHQCALAEINYPFCEEEHIPILRRISGGGTVFHDAGNINFSFFRTLDQDHKIDYISNLNIIAAALKKLGYAVKINERFDIYHEEHKISGNAQHIKRRKALHHGTILYDSDDQMLRKSIAKPAADFKTKAVQSVRSKIKNLRTIRDLGTSSEFFSALQSEIVGQGHTPTDTNAEKAEIAALILEKYSNPDWNYGYGPKYTFNKTHGNWDISLAVGRDSAIDSVQVKLNGISQDDLESDLRTKKHQPAALSSYILSLNSFSIEEKQSLIKAMF